MNNCIVIVDPYSAGALLAEALNARGARCIAVQSTPDLPPSTRSRFDPDLFAAIIHHSSALHDTLSVVQSHQPSHVIAGCESGVELAEYLPGRLNLHGKGLKTAQQFQSQDPEQISAATRSMTSRRRHQRQGLTKRAASVFLIPRRRGRLIRTNGLEKIDNLPTLHSISVSSRPGDVLNKVAGLVVLVDENPASIERDIDVIRRVEREGLFEVEKIL